MTQQPRLNNKAFSRHHHGAAAGNESILTLRLLCDGKASKRRRPLLANLGHGQLTRYPLAPALLQQTFPRPFTLLAASQETYFQATPL